MCSYVVSLHEVSVSGRRSRGAHCGCPALHTWQTLPALVPVCSPWPLSWRGCMVHCFFLWSVCGPLSLHLPVATIATPGVKIILHPGLSWGTVLGHLLPSWGWHWKAQPRQKPHRTFLVHLHVSHQSSGRTDLRTLMEMQGRKARVPAKAVRAQTQQRCWGQELPLRLYFSNGVVQGTSREVSPSEATVTALWRIPTWQKEHTEVSGARRDKDTLLSYQLF